VKIIVIGDIHGMDVWKEIIAKEEPFDKVVFLGDYFDSYHISFKNQIINYNEIIKYKEDNKDKVITLFGNHEFHYISDKISYSGWNFSTYKEIHELLLNQFNNKTLQCIYKYKDLIFSHAGITKYWLKNVAKTNLEALEENKINLDLLDFNFIKGGDPTGDSISQSLIWVRPKSLYINKLDKYTFIVGHTPTASQNVEIINDKIILCDCLPQGYLVVEVDKNNYKFYRKNLIITSSDDN
jgi:predicted MPP superfamily phosphohydrolase